MSELSEQQQPPVSETAKKPKGLFDRLFGSISQAINPDTTDFTAETPKTIDGLTPNQDKRLLERTVTDMTGVRPKAPTVPINKPGNK